jgi:hypothetical protein
MRPLRALPALLGLALLSSGCFGYRLMRPEEIELPSYTPRVVPMPETCDPLIARVAERGMAGVSEAEGRMALFCQQQMMIRANEEELVERRIEAHARAADFALHAATVVLTATIAVVGWLLF